jgi:hypothetical protein
MLVAMRKWTSSPLNKPHIQTKNEQGVPLLGVLAPDVAGYLEAMLQGECRGLSALTPYSSHRTKGWSKVPRPLGFSRAHT